MHARILVIPVLLAAAVPAHAWAQPARGNISGQIVDSARRPLADVDVFVRTMGRRTRTDSTGRYRLGDVKAGSYSLIARKVGYRHGEADVTLREGGSVQQDFVLTRRVVLERVEVSARGECQLRSIDGFFCRQQRWPGTFLDYPDIDYYGYTYTGELFRHLRGWRVTMRRAADGGTLPVPVRSGYCTMYLVDGRVVPWEEVPRYARDLTTMEVYVRPDSVPPEIRREMTFSAAPDRGVNARGCDAVVFWTRRAGY